MMKYPFELPFSEMRADLDTYVDAVFSCLESEFLMMPKGTGFIDYPVFEDLLNKGLIKRFDFKF